MFCTRAEALGWGLHGCTGIRRFGPLEALLPTLEEICLAGCNFDDLPAEVCGEEPSENVLAKVREYFFKAHVEKDDG